jgi:hypothetical protein
MANTWGSLEWGEGNFGEQNNTTVEVTGVAGNPIAWGSNQFGSASFGGVSNSIPLNLSEENVTVEVNQGWGRLAFGEENWGETGNFVSVSGTALSTSIANADDGWGELAWSAYNTRWGGQTSVDVSISQNILLSGQQLNISQGDEFAFTATEVFLSDNPLQGLTIAKGTTDAEPDAEATGQQLNTGLGSLTVYNEQGWGRDRWGVEVWGAEGIWASVQLNNTNLGLGVSSGVQETWGQDEWGATTTEWGGNSVTDVGILTIAAVTGNELTAAEGTVDPSPDATVIGVGLTAGVAVGSVVEADANVTITGIGLEIAQGQAELEAVTIANITGQALEVGLRNAVAGASAEIFPTGIGLTANAGSINVQSWQIVDTGTNVNWNIIDTAA